MKKTFDLSSLEWTLTGCTPYHWKLIGSMRMLDDKTVEVPAIPAQVPGSVQTALLRAGLLPDWNVGLNSMQSEWVENRHWIFQAALPDEWLKGQEQARLVCQGLDDRGWIYLNGQEVGIFTNAYLPHEFDLAPGLLPSGNLLQIIFDLPPRWLGQFGYTSRMTEWKARFYYTWDWVSRLVQIGVSDSICLVVGGGEEICSLHVQAGIDLSTGKGTLFAVGKISGTEGKSVCIRLIKAGTIKEQILPVEAFEESGIAWNGLDVELWWPNGLGDQPLYTLVADLCDGKGEILDHQERVVGFMHADWLPCAEAPKGADPWICAVNGKPVFLQGFNWTPVRPNYADLTEADYRLRLQAYHEMGCNVLRVWGGASPEKEVFFDLCDEMGLMTWQEFPLSSSGVENWPPEDERSIQELSEIAASLIERRGHHVSLLMWGGGNELQGGLDGSKTGIGKPVDCSHPLIARFAQIVAEKDPGRRFVATSSTGPRFSADPQDFGKGLHWDVHGPWKANPDLRDWEIYWAEVDALFHSEVGAPGASPAGIIRKTAGDLPVLPVDETNPLWRRSPWWIEAPLFLQEIGRQPESLEEYVEWSQARQAQALCIVASSLKNKFPRCGGVIFWMGHDCFPCTANTSVIDFEGKPKPAALALSKIFRK